MSARIRSSASSWRMSAWAAGLGYLSTLSCGTPEATEEFELGINEQAIFGGEIDEAEDWPGVLMLETKVSSQSVQACTGTLIAPNLVISALHCVAPLRDSNFQCNPDGSVNQLKPGAGELGAAVAAEEVKIRVGMNLEVTTHGKLLVTTNSLNICNNDLALVLLDTELDLPLSRVRLDEEVHLGEPLTIVGYGMTAVSEDLIARRAVHDIRISDLGSDLTGNTSTGAPPRTFVVGPSACKGDSGGPAFSKTADGAPVVVGVDSIIVGKCGSSTSRAIFTRLAPFKKIILSAFEKAGYPAWEEGQIEPGIYPEPIIPDGGFPEAGVDETTEEEVPVKAQRLKTGCSLGGSANTSEGAGYFALALPLVLALWFRRKTTPISLR
jgi:hypothetical protein